MCSELARPRTPAADMSEVLYYKWHKPYKPACQHLILILRTDLRTEMYKVQLPEVVLISILAKMLYFFFSSFSFFFRGVFQSLVTKHFPSEKQRREKGPGNKRKRMSTIFSVTYQKQILEKRLWTHSYLNVLFLDCICLLFSWPSFICCFQTGKPKGRQPKVPKHTVDSGGVINITDDSSSDSEGMDTDSNSSPDSLLDNDDVIFVNHTSCHTGG